MIPVLVLSTFLRCLSLQERGDAVAVFSLGLFREAPASQVCVAVDFGSRAEDPAGSLHWERDYSRAMGSLLEERPSLGGISLAGNQSWNFSLDPFLRVYGFGQDRPLDPGRVDPPHGSWDGWGNHFSGKAWKEYVWDDTLTQPEVLLPLGLAVSAAAISHWDKTLQRHWQGLLGDRGYYSDGGQYTLIGAVILIGAFLPGEGRNWWDEWWTIGEAYAASSLAVFALKTGVKRPRPGGSGIGTHSFPSGHSTSAFTAATLIEANSGPILGLPAYGLAAFTAFERVEEGRHYPSDILAGAAIGTLSASIFDGLHWGRAPGDGGIARPSLDAKVGLVDGLHGFNLEFTMHF